jgi:hypothetical protein
MTENNDDAYDSDDEKMYCNLCGVFIHYDNLIYRPDVFGIDDISHENGDLYVDCDICLECDAKHEQKDDEME